VLQNAARVEGRSPRQTEWMRATAQRPAAGTVRNLFGTWQAALHAAGSGPGRSQTPAARGVGSPRYR
jgi:hypothetical protein